jgi:thymidine phosphorylase
MDNPLGSAIGNALEVREAVRLLRGEPVPDDLAHESRLVAVRLLGLKGIQNPEEAVEKSISSGSAYEKLQEFVQAQGGDVNILEDLPVSDEIREVRSPQNGYVSRFAALDVGQAALALGAGREKKDDEVDPGAGVEMLVKPGDWIEKDQPVARLYGRRNIERAEGLIEGALEISEEPVEPAPAILDSL